MWRIILTSCERMGIIFHRNVNITFAHAETIIETTRMTNEQIIAQTMALLASKHRYVD